MKKLKLKKQADIKPTKRIGYKIDYVSDLNPAQYEAVMHNNGPALVIAGAGTGKTRTLIYRVARLVEDGVPPESILLLTFTRKAAAEMLRRAASLLDGRCEKVSGGTFHSFAVKVLRVYSKQIGYEQNFTVLDASDSADVINLIRTQMKFDAAKKRFPRKETLSRVFNLVVNRRETIEDVIVDEYPYYMDFIDEVQQLFDGFNAYKKRYNMMDYDDMLTGLLNLLKEHENVRNVLNNKYKYVMVDEYQDTNKLQHEIVKYLSGKKQNILAVGDDAQSIYSFRGAEFKNIMEFPNIFENCKVYKIEENYRSVDPLLKLTNRVIEAAAFKYEKELFTRRTEGDLPMVISCQNERQQSLFIAQQVLELREEGIELEDIAVLFRSGFLSFDLEIELAKANIPYLKFGGMKFIETAHIKDVLSYFKVLHNPNDAISWHRILLLLDGVGPRTAEKVITTITNSKKPFSDDLASGFHGKSGDKLKDLFKFLSEIKGRKVSIGEKAELISNSYKPVMKTKYDDWQKRWKDIEMFISIAERYSSLNEFLSDMAIDPPYESVLDLEPESKEEEFLTLSTVHSAKGLEWRAVFIIWALDGRFPSTKAIETLESIEEERRLFYVACTRAKEYLYITYPINIFDRESGMVLSKPSRFIDGISEDILDKYMLDEVETEEN
jgi:DNA helicase-2/ATP-dependent DNA helicase PcrA